MPYTPFLHQEKAFKRVQAGKSTIIATGTGSGKTEGFLVPILDYCYKHRGDSGIKAIIIYPMNALANDQSKRLARLVHDNPKLKGTLRAGLFIGERDESASMVMTPDGIITNRDTLRLTPPDILLTNYKMLDYLLIRPRDYPLWKDNQPESLRYLVVDELHAFDGAQGTDLACLIRRLKDRVQTPKGHLCCVGTSATLGGEQHFDDLRSYATQVFAEEFDNNAVITESLLSAEEFLAGDSATNDQLPTIAGDVKSYEEYAGVEAYLLAQHNLWFGEATGDGWKLKLSKELRQHPFFRSVLVALGNRPLAYNDLIEGLSQTVPGFAGRTAREKVLLIESLLSLVSVAREKVGDREMPFLQVRTQLWQRELRRAVANVSKVPMIAFSDDLKEDRLRTHLPVIHCRECGVMGWGGTMRSIDTAVNPDLQHFYVTFFAYNPTTVYIFPRQVSDGFPGENIETGFLCGDCLQVIHTGPNGPCPMCKGHGSIVPVVIFNPRIKEGESVRSNHHCPYCNGYESLTVFGSRAASLISVAIGQLFASRYNDHKKLLAFSDSVQDASHRSGFFSARTYRFNLRSAIQQCVEQQDDTIPLNELQDRFKQFWSTRKSPLEFITTFLPPDLSWFEDYEYLVQHNKLPDGSGLPQDLEKRLSWEILSEYGFNSRIGRTLEKSGSSIAFVKPDHLNDAVLDLREILRNEFGGLRALDVTSVQRFVAGIITQLKGKGGIFHDALKSYIENWGGYYKITFIPYMPNIGKRSRTPVFVTRKRGTRFDTLLSGGPNPSTWYEQWAIKCFGQMDPVISSELESLYEITLRVLTEKGILEQVLVQNLPVWGLKPSVLLIGKEVSQLRCSDCGHNVSISKGEAKFWQDAPCLRFSCGGRYTVEEAVDDYYRRLYSTGEVQRIFSDEHTALLDRKKREEIERRFAEGKNPADPNLLSCTPTLEMGIDIGDLSSVILCSVPPSQSSYLQRVGRSGRRDGTAFNLTIATGRPHDQYFYAVPEEMIDGAIEPPGCFLNASAVLERQLTAYCFDRWVNATGGKAQVPHKLGQVLTNLQRKDQKKKTFPFDLLGFIDAHRTVLLDSFLLLFQDSISTDSKSHLKTFIEGNEGAVESLTYKIVQGLAALGQERDSMRKKVQKLGALIKERETSPVKDANYESDLDALTIEKTSLEGIVNALGEKDTFNFFTDEGLLPNYAFPQAGAILRSVIWRKSRNDQARRKYETKVFEYERPAASAIHEFALDNNFYAEGRKVHIDQVNMALSETEEWRFCTKCSHHELASSEVASSCPRCGSELWPDETFKRRMLRMRQVTATTSDKESRSHDESDDREPMFYNKRMMAVVGDENIRAAYKLDTPQLPFGFELLTKATFREINFGQKGKLGDFIQIAGVDVLKTAFSVCKECGKVLDNASHINHAVTCRYYRSKNEKPILDYLFLYRDFSSEAIRILLPITAFSGSTTKLHSFIAALYLGLRKKFRGKIDHLQTMVDEEPPGALGYGRKYLLLYDTVPGGTGYLKELMSPPDSLIEVFQRALDVLRSCDCQKDPERDGCYRCIYAYRYSDEMADISRDTAIGLLNDIISHKETLVATDSVKNISLNVLYESELEARFIEALRRSSVDDRPALLKQDVVNGKPGWHLTVGKSGYFIEPQVELGPEHGVMVPSRADFVFYPEREQEGVRPIVIFTDGFTFHADAATNHLRIGKDFAQRMALVRSGRYQVWSLTWDDVDNRFSPLGPYFENFLTGSNHKLTALLHAYDPEFAVLQLSQVHQLDAFEMLMTFLALPDMNIWRMYALIHGVAGLSTTIDDKVIQDLSAKLLKESSINILPQLKQNDAGEYLAGIYHRDYEEKLPKLIIASFIDKASLQRRQLTKARVICRMFDDDAVNSKTDFKQAWNGFTRIFNIYQFVPDAQFVTSNGIADGEYDTLWTIKARTDFERASARSGQTEELMNLSNPLVHSLLAEIGAKGLPLPVVGFELQGSKGEVTSSAELAWPNKKLACLLESEEPFEPQFHKAGWRTIVFHSASDSVDKVMAMLSSV
jgi:DEAD/DEAH box helicase domain-containing protein